MQSDTSGGYIKRVTHPISISVPDETGPSVERLCCHTGKEPAKAGGLSGSPQQDRVMKIVSSESQPVISSVADSSQSAQDASAPDHCGRLPFLIRRDGVWIYQGTPVRRKSLVCLFASALKRDKDGQFWLQTPTERGIIEVEDRPFVAISLQWQGRGQQQVLVFRTNVDQVIEVDSEHPLLVDWEKRSCDCDELPPPTLLVRSGEGDFPVEARLSRPVWYELAALAEPGQWRGHSCLGVWSNGTFFPLSCQKECQEIIS